MKKVIFCAAISAVSLLCGCMNKVAPVESQVSSESPASTSEQVVSSTVESSSESHDSDVPSAVAPEKISRIVLVGDSRIAQLGDYLYGMTLVDDYLIDEETPDGDHIIGAGGEGYNWLSEHTADIEDKLTDGCALVVNMGVNGVPYFHTEIAEWCNDMAAKYKDKGVKVYFLSVTPVNDRLLDSYGYYIRNVDVVCFNSEIRTELRGVTYLDAYSVVKEDILGEGSGTYDGLHYYESEYRKIRDYTWEVIKG